MSAVPSPDLTAAAIRTRIYTDRTEPNGGEVSTVNACTEGCYKHYDKASGKWACCKCGS